jgi:hypothetical protein
MTCKVELSNYIDFIAAAAKDVHAAAASLINAEAAGLAGKPFAGIRAKSSLARVKGINFFAGLGISPIHETIPDRGRGSYEPPDPNQVDVPTPRRGSINYLNMELDELEARYAATTDPKERRRLAELIKRKRRERDRYDPLNRPGGSAGGGTGRGAGNVPAEDKTIPGSPAWIREQIRLVEKQIDKATDLGDIRRLQGKRDKLQAQLDALLGNDRGGDGAATPKPPKGSINDLQNQLRDAQEAYDNATTDAARAKAAERIKVLEAEIDEKKALLRDAEREMDRSGSNVITIESPIANLDGIVQLGKEIDRVYASASQSLSQGFSGISATVGRSGSLAGATGALSGIDTTVQLPSYQAQLDMAGQLGAHVGNFGLHVDWFGQFVRQLNAPAVRRNLLSEKARGEGVNTFNLQ